MTDYVAKLREMAIDPDDWVLDAANELEQYQILHRVYESMRNNNIVASQLIEAWVKDNISTHHEECWKYHPACAIMMACHEISRLQSQQEALLWELNHLKNK